MSIEFVQLSEITHKVTPYTTSKGICEKSRGFVFEASDHGVYITVPDKVQTVVMVPWNNVVAIGYAPDAKPAPAKAIRKV